MGKYDGKVAIVTGASRGVGAATALALAEEGAKVVLAARSTAANPQKTPGTLEATLDSIEAIGGEALLVPTNLNEDDDVVAMVAKTVEHFGRLDILINNAAITFVGDLDIPLKRYDLVMQVNLRAPLIAMREAIPHLKAAGEGRIINVSSVAANYPVDGLMAYGISKIGLERLSVDVARQVAKDNINCNVFRIDIGVASEGFVANAPGVDHSAWEPTSVAAEGIMWMLDQPISYSGQRESMFDLRLREGIMETKISGPPSTIASRPIQDLVRGVFDTGPGGFEEPHQG
jgi:NAD(P)-dependent dehydrogenase (short-subunit alcohol dehydrogenase family)